MDNNSRSPLINHASGTRHAFSLKIFNTKYDMAGDKSILSGTVIEVEYESQLPEYLKKYGLSDSPDSFMLQGSGVIVLKAYGKFEQEVRDWYRQLQESL
jgi:hypothetical protein